MRKTDTYYAQAEYRNGRCPFFEGWVIFKNGTYLTFVKASRCQTEDQAIVIARTEEIIEAQQSEKIS